MKKILLLAALAAPLAMSAQAAGTGDVLQYELPAGTFFTLDGNALLSAGIPLTWTNTSYYVNDNGEILPLAPDTYYWAYASDEGAVISNSVNLETPADFLPITALKKVGQTPILVSKPLSTTGGFTGRIYGASKIADGYYTYNRKGANVNVSPLFSYTSEDVETLNKDWASQTSGVSSLNVLGFAQKIEYPGTPYMITNLCFNGNYGGPTDASYVISIYEAPSEGNALPEEPICQIESGAKFEPVRIESDVIVTVTDIEGTYNIWTLLETPDADKPEITNKGAYAVVDYGNGVPELLASTEPVKAGEPVATAMDLWIAMYYPFIQPVAVEGTAVSASEPLTVNFTDAVTNVTVRVASSAKAADVAFDEEQVPSWLSVTVSDPTLADVQAIDETATTLDDAQFVLINFAEVSEPDGTAEILFNVPGGATTSITVKTPASSGIDSVAAPEAEVVGREYYDLSGRRLNAAPVKGFYIEKSIRADGSSSAARRIR